MRYNYKGLVVQTNGNAYVPEVKVFWIDCFLNPLYRATSLDLATRWIDAYQRGEQWAIDARLPARIG